MTAARASDARIFGSIWEVGLAALSARAVQKTPNETYEKQSHALRVCRPQNEKLVKRLQKRSEASRYILPSKFHAHSAPASMKGAAHAFPQSFRAQVAIK
eukprot:512088-Pleurochrysis_carterae.AAC.2